MALIEVDMPIDLTRAKLNGLDQAWMLKANFTGATFDQTSLFQTQLGRANLAGADFTRTDFSADMTNQSMGLMCGILRKANAKGNNFTDATFMRADLEFADLADANLSGANMMGITMAGADLTGANVTNAQFGQADVTSARLVALICEGAAQFESAKKLERAERN